MHYKESYDKWIRSEVVDNATKAELTACAEDEAELKERFSEMLGFGTAGIRGKMRAGLAGINIYTVRHATQGFADVIKNVAENSPSVVIAYDCRNNSKLFAISAACVFAANGIQVKMFDGIRPTPELSFAVRELRASAGVNITASHNTKEYNGYKAYGSDGAQLSPKYAGMVSAAMERTDIFSGVAVMEYEDAVSQGLISTVDNRIDEKYIESVLEQSVKGEDSDEALAKFPVVYTPFYGAGYKLVPEVLKRLGMKNVITVDEQMVPNGDFPTLKSPNPENPEGFRLAVELAKKHDIDLIIGTDPDSDRCAAVVRDNGEYEVLTGNQLGVLLLDYLISMRKEHGLLPEKAVAIKSIVSTPMFDKICEMNAVECISTPTGFKFIGRAIENIVNNGSRTFIFGFEESIGFLAGTYCRDKDAVLATMLISEMACRYSVKGMNLRQALNALHEKYGHYRDKTVSIVYEGTDAKEKMSVLMTELRNHAPSKIGKSVIAVKDYNNGIRTDLRTGATDQMDISDNDVLVYELEDGCALAVRPSGTEPKLKMYVMGFGDDGEQAAEAVSEISKAGLQLLKG